MAQQKGSRSGLRPFTPEDRQKAQAARSAKAAARRAGMEEAEKAKAMAAELAELNRALRDQGIELAVTDDRFQRHPDLLKQLLGHATTMMLAPIVTGAVAPTNVKEAAAAAEMFHRMLKIEQGRAGLLTGSMGPADPLAQADRRDALKSFAQTAKARLNGGVTSITEAPSAQAQ